MCNNYSENVLILECMDNVSVIYRLFPSFKYVLNVILWFNLILVNFYDFLTSCFCIYNC